jgi:exonuclease SbcC
VIRKIVLENYMSHARTEIEPAAGLTVLVGPNNCGKSAVVSALETLARTTRGDFMVRHGEKEARVTVETDDGHTIVWRRKGGTVSYVLDGREVHREVPDDLHEHLKLPLVKSERGDYEFDVHFGQQKSPIFLLNEPPSRAATFFSASSDAGRLLEIQDKHRDKVRERKRRRGDLTKEVAQLDQQLQSLDGLGDLAEQVEQLEIEHAEVLEGQTGVRELAHAIARLEAVHAAMGKWHAESAALRPLTWPPALEDAEPLQWMIEHIAIEQRAAAKAADARRAANELKLPPELADVRPLAELAQKLAAATGAHVHRTARRAALEPLRPEPELMDAGSAEDLLLRLRHKFRDAARLQQVHESLSKLVEAPQLPDPQPLQMQIATLTRAAARASGDAAAVLALAELRDPPTELDPSSLEESLAALATAQRLAATAQETVAAVARELAAVASDVQEWVAAHPACPICGTAVSADQLLHDPHGGHAHG